jgi:hypothetical protein
MMEIVTCRMVNNPPQDPFREPYPYRYSPEKIFSLFSGKVVKIGSEIFNITSSED